MGTDDNVVAGFQMRRDFLAPVGQHPLQRHRQRLAARKNFGGQTGIAGIKSGMPLIIQVELRGRNVIAAPPDLDLFLAVPGLGLCLVQPRQRTVMPFVQTPGLVDRDPDAIHGLKRQPERPDGPRQHRGVCANRSKAFCLQQLTGAPRLRFSFRSQIDIYPTGKPVLQIPLTLTVADEDKTGHGRS